MLPIVKGPVVKALPRVIDPVVTLPPIVITPAATALSANVVPDAIVTFPADVEPILITCAAPVPVPILGGQGSCRRTANFLDVFCFQHPHLCPLPPSPPP